MDKALFERIAADPAFEGPLTGIPYAEFLGLRVVRQGPRVLTHLPYDDALMGAPQRLHGGVTGAVLEFAAMIQVLADAHDKDGLPSRLPKPIGMTVEYLRAGHQKDLWASAAVERQGRRVVNIRAEAWQDDQASPIAAALAHFLIPSD